MRRLEPKSESASIRAAVIGVGAMGKQHARIYNDLPGVTLVGVADKNMQAAQEVARRYHTAAYAGFHDLLQHEAPDLVSIVVPTRLHREVALAAIERGVHVLVEKPIASTEDEGAEMIMHAHARGVKLAVGHVERFNPAVIELKRRLALGELGRVFQIHARRLGPFPARVRDVGVVIDLAAHDLDIMWYLIGAEVTRIYAETERRVHTEHEDLLSGLLRFADGTVGVLDVNWLTPTKVRELAVTGERGMFLVNYLTQELYFYENETTVHGWDTLSILRGVEEGRTIRLRVEKKEPLRAELEAFVDAVVGNKELPVTGEDGLRALRLAHQVVEAGREHKIVTLDTVQS
ncbi:MAG: oxidoreductase [Chloroflexi bacterium RBG_16_57_9]|nr:MAG: oxidoreductase [Chloroflexi bacterium RBG_16_57_9]